MCALRISKDRYLHADVQYNNRSGRWIEMRLIDLVVEKRRGYGFGWEMFWQLQIRMVYFVADVGSGRRVKSM